MKIGNGDILKLKFQVDRSMHPPTGAENVICAACLTTPVRAATSFGTPHTQKQTNLFFETETKPKTNGFIFLKPKLNQKQMG